MVATSPALTGFGGMMLPVMTVMPALSSLPRSASMLASQTSGSSGSPINLGPSPPPSQLVGQPDQRLERMPHHFGAEPLADLGTVDDHRAMRCRQVDAVPIP